MLVGRRDVSVGVVLIAALAFVIVLAVMPTGLFVGRRDVSAGVVLIAALAFVIVLAVMLTGLYQDNNHSQIK
ncbi:unnamed protein product [Anisakis simplex]|uniref:ABC transporter permease n=1 Tax=Anisakis simplex TaxID=6269 RepID=A0A0M3KFH5_ANISI|nr:unnamed protein product [Anisakis simplex]